MQYLVQSLYNQQKIWNDSSGHISFFFINQHDKAQKQILNYFEVIGIKKNIFGLSINVYKMCMVLELKKTMKRKVKT